MSKCNFGLKKQENWHFLLPYQTSGYYLITKMPSWVSSHQLNILTCLIILLDRIHSFFSPLSYPCQSSLYLVDTRCQIRNRFLSNILPPLFFKAPNEYSIVSSTTLDWNSNVCLFGSGLSGFFTIMLWLLLLPVVIWQGYFKCEHVEKRGIVAIIKLTCQ